MNKAIESIMVKNAALIAILDICPDFTLSRKDGQYRITMKFGVILYDKTFPLMSDFTEDLGQFICSLPSGFKEKYLNNDYTKP